MKIKKPSNLSPRMRREAKQINCMAGLIKDQTMLDKLLENSTPAMRAAMLERIGHLLPFVPLEQVTPDCPHCGMRKGSVIDHECVTEANASEAA
jgi:hypothetical protein